jgi:CRISPR system Cascade subunit CasA
MTTLPGALARLASGELSDFPRLRTHQIEPWSMFLTQLAGIALHREGTSNPRLGEEDWRRLLLRLTGDQTEPWCVVVEDLSKPAFFQPPVPEATVEQWSTADHPDDLDILVTSKTHDVKRALIHADDVEAWTYALMTLQTMQGRPGRGYNRIARMNGAYGNRPRIGVASDISLASRFVRDVGVILDSWSDLLDRGYQDSGIALTWLESWDGAESLSMRRLMPHFVEVCWRVRCRRRTERELCCRYTTTAARRCIPEVDNGDVGDPWIPVERDGGALTVGPNGFDYRLLTRLFQNEFAPAAAQTLRREDADPVCFIASGLARGQGKTEGLHERVLVLQGKARILLGSADQRAALGRRAAARVLASAEMRKKVLFRALKQLAVGGVVPSDSLDARVDEIFFDHLFETLDLSDEDAQTEFAVMLRKLAKTELSSAVERSGLTGIRRYRAFSNAEREFARAAANFPGLAARSAQSAGADQ